MGKWHDCLLSSEVKQLTIHLYDLNGKSVQNQTGNFFQSNVCLSSSTNWFQLESCLVFLGQKNGGHGKCRVSNQWRRSVRAWPRTQKLNKISFMLFTNIILIPDVLCWVGHKENLSFEVWSEMFAKSLQSKRLLLSGNKGMQRIYIGQKKCRIEYNWWSGSEQEEQLK